MGIVIVDERLTPLPGEVPRRCAWCGKTRHHHGCTSRCTEWERALETFPELVPVAKLEPLRREGLDRARHGATLDERVRGAVMVLRCGFSRSVIVNGVDDHEQFDAYLRGVLGHRNSWLRQHSDVYQALAARYGTGPTRLQDGYLYTRKRAAEPARKCA